MSRPTIVTNGYEPVYGIKRLEDDLCGIEMLKWEKPVLYIHLATIFYESSEKFWHNRTTEFTRTITLSKKQDNSWTGLNLFQAVI